MNKVVLLGRLTKDIELRYTQSNTAVVSFTLAVNRKDKADFINCVAWNKQAEFISKYFFNKGSQICLVGRLSTRDYEKDSKKVYVTEVVVEEVYFTGKKENGLEINYADEDTNDLPF